MRKILKRLLRKVGLVIVRSHNSRVRYLDHPAESVFGSILLRVFPSLEGLNFIQIGANDGIRADPIRNYVTGKHWRGLLVEPLPYYYAELRRNYANRPDLTLLNAAVDRASGERLMFQIRPELLAGLPHWAGGLASFSEQRLRDHAIGLKLTVDAIVSKSVRTVTWDEICERFGPRACDVLVVDVEGYDIELLRQADLGRMRPRVIHFEHVCVTRAERLAYYGELLDLGYELATSGGDTIAYRTPVD